MDVLKNVIFAMRDGRNFDDLALILRDGVASKLAERTFNTPYVRENRAFDDHLGVRGNKDRHGLSFDNSQRFSHHSADDSILILVCRSERLRPEREERMDTDDDRNR